MGRYCRHSVQRRGCNGSRRPFSIWPVGRLAPVNARRLCASVPCSPGRRPAFGPSVPTAVKESSAAAYATLRPNANDAFASSRLSSTRQARRYVAYLGTALGCERASHGHSIDGARRWRRPSSCLRRAFRTSPAHPVERLTGLVSFMSQLK